MPESGSVIVEGSRKSSRVRQQGATTAIAAVTVIAAMVLGGCGGTPAHRDGADHAGGGSIEAALPGRHVHGVARNPGNGDVYLATHDGLFRLGPGTEPTRIGPVIDLMGFAVAGPDHFYASGHPGPGTPLSNPVGLIESTDGGQTWTALSRQGRSDFHTLTVSPAGIVGFDGDELAATNDGRFWHSLTPPATPFAAAASPDGKTLLISSEAGLTRSLGVREQVQELTQPPLLTVGHERRA